jgi:hypothetical protein
VKAMGSEPIRTRFRSPWQNGIAERWVGSVRRDLLDHAIVLNRRHLRRLLKEYVRYYHEDPSRTWEGHSRWASFRISAFESSQGYLVATTRWAASPLYGRGLTIFGSELKLLRCQDRREIHAWILAVELSRSLPGRS